MRRADLRLLDEIGRVRDLRHVQILEEALVAVQPADMGRGEGDVAFGIVLAEVRLVQPVDGAPGDELDLDTGFLGELRCDGLGDEVGNFRPSC